MRISKVPSAVLVLMAEALKSRDKKYSRRKGSAGPVAIAAAAFEVTPSTIYNTLRTCIPYHKERVANMEPAQREEELHKARELLGLPPTSTTPSSAQAEPTKPAQPAAPEPEPFIRRPTPQEMMSGRCKPRRTEQAA